MVICELNRPFLSTWWTLVHLENSFVFCEGAGCVYSSKGGDNIVHFGLGKEGLNSRWKL